MKSYMMRELISLDPDPIDQSLGSVMTNSRRRSWRLIIKAGRTPGLRESRRAGSDSEEGQNSMTRRDFSHESLNISRGDQSKDEIAEKRNTVPPQAYVVQAPNETDDGKYDAGGEKETEGSDDVKSLKSDAVSIGDTSGDLQAMEMPMREVTTATLTPAPTRRVPISKSESEPVCRFHQPGCSECPSQCPTPPASPSPSPSSYGDRGRQLSTREIPAIRGQSEPPPVFRHLPAEERYLEPVIIPTDDANMTHSEVVNHLYADLSNDKEKQGKEGCVYILQDPEKPEWLKIGHAQAVSSRRTQIKRICMIKKFDQHWPLPLSGNLMPLTHAIKVEGLVHRELGYFRRTFTCGTGRRFPNSHREKTHREYFEIDVATAKAVIERWTAFVEAGAYGASGRLKGRWSDALTAHWEAYKSTVVQDHEDHSGRHAWWQRFTDEPVAPVKTLKENSTAQGKSTFEARSGTSSKTTPDASRPGANEAQAEPSEASPEFSHILAEELRSQADQNDSVQMGDFVLEGTLKLSLRQSSDNGGSKLFGAAISARSSLTAVVKCSA